MTVNSFLIDDKERQIQGLCIKAEIPCKCGCTETPFVLISNGIFGLSVSFETEKELTQFKQQVNRLQILK